jgi:hypothetical protein
VGGLGAAGGPGAQTHSQGALGGLRHTLRVL